MYVPWYIHLVDIFIIYYVVLHYPLSFSLPKLPNKLTTLEGVT